MLTEAIRGEPTWCRSRNVDWPIISRGSVVSLSTSKCMKLSVPGVLTLHSEPSFSLVITRASECSDIELENVGENYPSSFMSLSKLCPDFVGPRLP